MSGGLTMRRLAMRTIAILTTLGLALLAGVAPARAADDVVAPPAAEAPSHWTFEAMPYIWIPGNFGTLTVKGRSAAIDVSVKDALDVATSGNAFTGSGWFSLAYDEWSVFVDAFGGYAEVATRETVPTQLCTVDVAGRAKMKFDFVDVALGYRLGQWTLPHRHRPMDLGLYLGARYLHFDTTLNAQAGVVGSVARAASSFEAFDWADAIVGVRWDVPILDPLALEFRGDLGGFDPGSDFMWNLVGGARWWLPWTPWSLQPWLSAGYRVLAFDRASSESDGIGIQFRGPMAGMGVRF
jgi:hypothetical protein